MNKDDILKEFDTLAEAKRKGAVNLKLCLGFALLVVLLVLAWGLTVNFSALNKVVVVERSGEYLKTHAEDAEDLFIALVKNTCSEATRYANSFDRLDMKRNQAHAAFYINKNDLKPYSPNIITIRLILMPFRTVRCINVSLTACSVLPVITSLIRLSFLPHLPFIVCPDRNLNS